MQNAPAGWYPTTENPSITMYWDGERWLADSETPTGRTTQASRTPAPTGAEKTKKRRRVPLWVAITAGAAGLVLGAAVMGPDADLTSYKEQVATLETDLTQAQGEVAEAEDALAEAEQSFADEKTALALQAEDALEQVQTAEKRAKDAEQQAEDARKEADEAASVQPAAEVPAPAASTPEAGSGSAYYQNCTAARNAGAAPVHAGDPGYGPHLDRDGDGVGCE